MSRLRVPKWWAAQHRAVLAAARASATPIHHRVGALPILDHLPPFFVQPDAMHRALFIHAVDLPGIADPYEYRKLERAAAPRVWFPEAYGPAPVILVRSKHGTLLYPDAFVALPYFRALEAVADGLAMASEGTICRVHRWIATVDRRILDRCALIEAAAGPERAEMVVDYLRAAGCPGC